MIYVGCVAWGSSLGPITFDYEFSRDRQLFENVWKKPQNEISPKFDWALTPTMHCCVEGNSILKKGMLWYYLIQSLLLLLGQLKLAPIVRKSTLVLVFVHKCRFVYWRTQWSFWEKVRHDFWLEIFVRYFWRVWSHKWKGFFKKAINKVLPAISKSLLSKFCEMSLS